MSENIASTEGGPEPTDPLGDRNRDRLKLLSVGVVLTVLTVRINEVLNWAWDAEGVGHEFVFGVTEGTTVDLMIVAPAGLIAGWLVLFVLDRTKRFQKLFVVLGAVVFVIWNVFVGENWIEQVAWGDLWYVTVLAFVGGIVSGVLPQLRSGRRQWEYPVAAAGLFLFVAVLGIVGFLDVYWFAADSVPGDAASTVLVGPKATGAVLLDAMVLLVFLAMLGNFVLYNDVQSVAFLNSNDEAAMATLVGLFYHVDDKYRGRGPDCLVNGYGRLHSGQTPPADLCDGTEIEFTYLPPGRFPQWVTVSADSISIDDLDDEELEDASALVRRGPVRRIAGVLVTGLVPGSVQRRLQSDVQRVAARVLEADVLVFVATNPDSVTRFEEIGEHVPDHTDTVVIAAEGVMEENLNLPLQYDVVEVNWTGDELPLVTGIEEVRKRLDG